MLYEKQYYCLGSDLCKSSFDFYYRTKQAISIVRTWGPNRDTILVVNRHGFPSQGLICRSAWACTPGRRWPESSAWRCPGTVCSAIPWTPRPGWSRRARRWRSTYRRPRGTWYRRRTRWRNAARFTWKEKVKKKSGAAIAPLGGSLVRKVNVSGRLVLNSWAIINRLRESRFWANSVC